MLLTPQPLSTASFLARALDLRPSTAEGGAPTLSDADTEIFDREIAPRLDLDADYNLLPRDAADLAALDRRFNADYVLRLRPWGGEEGWGVTEIVHDDYAVEEQGWGRAEIHGDNAMESVGWGRADIYGDGIVEEEEWGVAEIDPYGNDDCSAVEEEHYWETVDPATFSDTISLAMERLRVESPVSSAHGEEGGAAAQESWEPVGMVPSWRRTATATRQERAASSEPSTYEDDRGIDMTRRDGDVATDEETKELGDEYTEHLKLEQLEQPSPEHHPDDRSGYMGGSESSLPPTIDIPELPGTMSIPEYLDQNQHLGRGAPGHSSSMPDSRSSIDNGAQREEPIVPEWRRNHGLPTPPRRPSMPPRNHGLPSTASALTFFPEYRDTTPSNEQNARTPPLPAPAQRGSTERLQRRLEALGMSHLRVDPRH